MLQDRIGPRPRRQPHVGVPRHHDREDRRLLELVPELPRDAETARGLGLPVQEHEVDRVLVDEAHRLVVLPGDRELDRDALDRALADSRAHLFDDRGPMTVKQDGVLSR